MYELHLTRATGPGFAFVRDDNKTLGFTSKIGGVAIDITGATITLTNAQAGDFFVAGTLPVGITLYQGEFTFPWPIISAALIVALFVFFDRTLQAASLDHALWLHRPVDPHQWHRYEAVALTHSDARGLARGSITAADGSSGANLGVGFVGVSGLSNDASFTYYSGAPSMQGVAYAHAFAPGDAAYINVAAGVEQGLTFWYSAPTAAAGGIKAYSGLNGSGTLLGSLDLAANSSAAYDGWSQWTLSFNGTARSFDVTASANNVAFDNISTVPEPASALLLAGGAGLLHLARRRSRR